MQVLTSASHTEPLRWTEFPDRPLGPDDVRVTVRAAGVNPVDWKMRQGDLLGMLQRLIGPPGTLVCGVDFAGDVTAIGSNVRDLAIGDRVVGGTDFSRKQYGSYARTVQVRADQVAVLPPEVAFDVAACLPVAAVTANTALFELGRLGQKPEPRALILGASGGVGHFAVQLAHAAGARAVGVCSTRNVALVERLGGTAIDYTQGDVAQAAAKSGPYDVVVDAIGSSTYPVAMCTALLKPGGVHVLVMPKGGDYWRVALPGPTVTVLGRPNRKTLAPLVKLVAEGKVTPVIAQRFSLDEAEQAQELSRGGKVVGKVVLVG